jgi:hypothetical protein
MTNPTNPFNWQMPTASDLVTDLPADFETFGQAVATSMADLLGGTTGQVLSKASNTDMDFTWVTSDDANAIQNSIVDAKGDLIAASANDTPARLAVGTNGQVLKANSATATGLEWGSASSAFIGCSVWSNSNQTITTTTVTAINFDQEIYDTNGFHSNTTNNSRITIPSGLDGKYLVTAKIDFSPNANGTRVVYHNVNGTLVNFAAYPVSSSSQSSSLTLSGVYNLTAGQYVELAGYQDSGSSLTSTGTAYYYNNLQVTYLGA